MQKRCRSVFLLHGGEFGAGLRTCWSVERRLVQVSCLNASASAAAGLHVAAMPREHVGVACAKPISVFWKVDLALTACLLATA